MLFVISFILAGIVLFNTFYRGADWSVVILLALGGLLLGLFVFSRMSTVQWNEEQEIVETGRMDTLGYITIALYVAFEIGLRTFLKDFYPVSATTFLLAALFGTLFGRALGTLVEMHRVLKAAHAGEKV